jgi:guanine deaminase
VPPDPTFMRRAIELGIEAVRERRGGPFGAVVVLGTRVVAEGANEVTSTNDPTAHAEIVAIRRACRALGTFQLTGCELYTSCEPCPMCGGAIGWARPDRVFYAGTRLDAAAAGFDDAALYEELARPPANRAIPAIEFLRDEALAAFRLWNDTTDRIPY